MHPILVIDDQFLRRMCLGLALEELGLSVETMGSGHEAYRALSESAQRRREFSVVVMDVSSNAGGLAKAQDLLDRTPARVPVLVVVDKKGGDLRREGRPLPASSIADSSEPVPVLIDRVKALVPRSSSGTCASTTVPKPVSFYPSVY